MRTSVTQKGVQAKPGCRAGRNSLQRAAGRRPAGTAAARVVQGFPIPTYSRESTAEWQIDLGIKGGFFTDAPPGHASRVLVWELTIVMTTNLRDENRLQKYIQYSRK